MSIEWQEIATWVGALGAVTTAGIAVVLAAQLRNRERRKALVELHLSLTSGETAAARNTIGTLIYSKKGKRKVDELQAVEAYFRLIWAIQRARNVFRIHGFHWASLDDPHGGRLDKRAKTEQIELSLTWNLREIAQNVAEFHNDYAPKFGVADGDAWDEMESYLTPH